MLLLKGEKNFMPLPQNRILIPVGSFLKFVTSTAVLFLHLTHFIINIFFYWLEAVPSKLQCMCIPVADRAWSLCAYWASDIFIGGNWKNWNVLTHWETRFQNVFLLCVPTHRSTFGNSKREGVSEAKILNERMTQTEIFREN